MGVDLFLNLSDEDAAWIREQAASEGRSFEEHLRKLLTEGAGHRYEPLSAEDILDNTRPHLMFDLRRPS